MSRRWDEPPSHQTDMKRWDCWETWFVASVLTGMAVYFFWDSVFDVNYRVLRRLRNSLEERGAVAQAEGYLRQQARRTTTSSG